MTTKEFIPTHPLQKEDMVDFSNTAKSALSAYSLITDMPQYVITEGSVGLFVNQEVDGEMIRDAAKILSGIKKASIRTTFGEKLFENYSDVFARIQFSDPESITPSFGNSVVTFIDTKEGPDAIVQQKDGSFKKWRNSEVPTKSELKTSKSYAISKWTDGGIKDGSVVGINLAYFAGEVEFSEFLDLTSQGLYSYYEDIEMTVAKYSEMVIRMSTDVAPSKNLHYIASQSEGVQLKRVSTSVVLWKWNQNDGQQFANAGEVVDALNVILNKSWDISAILSAPFQTRYCRVNKAASDMRAENEMVEILSARLEETGGTLYTYTFSEIEGNSSLREEIMRATDKEFHTKKLGNPIEGTRFKMGDVIKLVENADDIVTTYISDMNTIKAPLDPLAEMAIVVMNFAQKRSFDLKISSQALMTLFYQNEEIAEEYFVHKWIDKIDAMTNKITNPKSRQVMPHSLVKGFHYNSATALASEEMLSKDKKLFDSYLNKTMLAKSERDLNKNSVDDIGGMYAYGVPDYGHIFGVEVIPHDCVMSHDFWYYKAAKVKELEAYIAHYKGIISDDSIKKADKEHATLMLNRFKAEFILLKQNKISMYRSPKMSIYEIDFRTVLTFKNVCLRIDKLKEKGLLTEARAQILKDMYYHTKPGAIYMSADPRVPLVHSGSDWDIDAFSCIYDPEFNVLLGEIQRVMVSVQ